MTKDLNLTTQIDLLDDDKDLGEAFASVSLNPSFQWAKIVVTDDRPNLNKQRIPLEEFDNLIRTGLFSPIKMAESNISKGHDEALGKPIGTITQLAKEKNKVIALSALWKKERTDDISMLKDMYTKGTPPNVSWEISYADSKIEEDGTEALYGTSLNGLVVVGSPAYAGRTQFIAMAAVWDTAYVNDLPDSAFLYIEPGGSKDDEGKTVPRSLRHLPVRDKSGKLDAAHLRNAIARASQITGISPAKATELENKARKLLGSSQSEFTEESKEYMDELEQAKAKITELETQLAALKTEHDSATAELNTLKEFKLATDKKAADETKFAAIKQKFAEAKIEKDEKYFESNHDKLLEMTDEALGFMLQELIAFSAKLAEASAKKEETHVEIPDIVNKETGKVDPVALGRALRESKLNK